MKLITNIKFAKPEKPIQIKLRYNEFNLIQICENNWGQGDPTPLRKIRLPRVAQSYMN